MEGKPQFNLIRRSDGRGGNDGRPLEETWIEEDANHHGGLF
jgi:hypothetical protein